MRDAAGGDKAFTDSFWEMAKQIYPEDSPNTVRADHAIFTGGFSGGKPIKEAQFRKFALAEGAGSSGPPSLQAISAGGRIRILFSQYDFTSGLLGTRTWGISGYAPETAQALAENILRWAAARKK